MKRPERGDRDVLSSLGPARRGGSYRFGLKGSRDLSYTVACPRR